MARINPVIDGFDGVPGAPITSEGNWTHVRETNWQARPPLYQNGGAVGQDSGIHFQVVRRAGTFAADQYSQIALNGFRFLGPDYRLGVAVRCGTGIDAQSTYYAAWVYDNNENGATKEVALVKVVNGAITPLSFYSGGATWTNGDVIGLEVTGAGPVKLKVFKGATQIGSTVTDSTNPIQSGNPGALFTDTVWGDNWEGGDLAGNVAPVFAGQVPNISTVSGTSKTQAVTGFSDPGDTLTYSLVGAPSGVSIGAGSGTITVASSVGVGTYSGIVVRATDAGGLTADSNPFTVTVTAQAPAPTPVAFNGQVSPQSPTVGSDFSLALASYFTGSATPFTYSVLSGSLPAGLTLNSSTGVISGKPTAAGSAQAVVRATDANGATAQTGTIMFNVATVAPPGATTASVTLTSDGTTPKANLSGLKWAFFEQALPSLFTAPVAKGSNGTTNASGVLTVGIGGTTLQPGQTGWLSVTDGDGTVSNTASVFAGPVTVAA